MSPYEEFLDKMIGGVVADIRAKGMEVTPGMVTLTIVENLFPDAYRVPERRNALFSELFPHVERELARTKI
jgi:hypothetical protein